MSDGERQNFFELADRLAQATDPEERSRLEEERARITFGEENRKPRLDDIAEHCARLPVQDPRTPDEILGYDEHGLPRLRKTSYLKVSPMTKFPFFPPPSTTPAPLLRRANQLSFHRISFDIGDGVHKVLFIPNEAIEVFAEPEVAGTSQDLIGLMRGEGLPGMNDGSEGPGLSRLDQRVDVVGHEAPGDQTVTLGVEVQEGVFDEGGDAGIAEPAGAVAGVFVGGQEFAELGVPASGSEGFVAGQLGSPGFDERLGDGVVEAEGQGLDEVGVIEVGEVASGVPGGGRGGLG